MWHVDDYHSICLKCTDEVQKKYEAIRPILLYDHSLDKRSEETKIHIKTLKRYLFRFKNEGGIKALEDHRLTPSITGKSLLPIEIKNEITTLKSMAPECALREIQRYIFNKYLFKPHIKTIKNYLKSDEFDFRFQEIKTKNLPVPLNPYEAKVEAVKLRKKGFNFKTIASILRKPINTVRDAWQKFNNEKNFSCLQNKPKKARESGKKFTFPNIVKILHKQIKYPDLGSWRIMGLIQKEGDYVGRTTIWKMMKFNLENYELKEPIKREIRIAPYKPQYRHQFWFIDIRYLVKLEDIQMYSICLLEGYSRKILSGDVFDKQNLLSILKVIFPAFWKYGLPEAFVSDNGGVFKANRLLAIMIFLGINWCYIEKGKPWQDLIEALFSIQHRMFDAISKRSTTEEALRINHKVEFIDMYNETNHWAHKNRKDQRKTPDKVLDWVQGKEVSKDRLQYAFKENLIGRKVTKEGFTRLHNFYLFTIMGYGKVPVSIALTDDKLIIESNQQVFAEYDYSLNKYNEIKTVNNPNIKKPAVPNIQLSIFNPEDNIFPLHFKKKRKKYKRKETAPNVEQPLLPFMEYLAS